MLFPLAKVMKTKKMGVVHTFIVCHFTRCNVTVVELTLVSIVQGIRPTPEGPVIFSYLVLHQYVTGGCFFGN